MPGYKIAQRAHLVTLDGDRLSALLFGEKQIVIFFDGSNEVIGSPKGMMVINDREVLRELGHVLELFDPSTVEVPIFALDQVMSKIDRFMQYVKSPAGRDVELAAEGASGLSHRTGAVI